MSHDRGGLALVCKCGLVVWVHSLLWYSLLGRSGSEMVEVKSRVGAGEPLRADDHLMI